MDHYADDLATVVDALALKDISMFGFSTGGGEVARYVARHGTSRVAKLGLISAVTPIMLRTPDHPAGVPIEVFDGIRARSEEHTSELQSLMRISYAVFCLQKQKIITTS